MSRLFSATTLVRRVLGSSFAMLAICALSSCKSNPEPTVQPAADPNRVLPHAHDIAKANVTEQARTITVGGATRKYVLVAPQALDPAPWLVLVLHGDGGTASSFHALFPFEKGSGNRAVLAYPEGIGRTWDLETTDDNRDEAFAVALIDSLKKEFHVDDAHVFATGYSSGGFFVNVLACHRPGLLRAITSSAAGAPYNQKTTWPNGYPGCPNQKPVAMMAMHGTLDTGVTLQSGKFSAQYWSYVNGCNLREQETTGYGQCRAYRECPQNAPVVYCEIKGLSHWVWDESAEASTSFFATLDK